MPLEDEQEHYPWYVRPDLWPPHRLLHEASTSIDDEAKYIHLQRTAIALLFNDACSFFDKTEQIRNAEELLKFAISRTLSSDVRTSLTKFIASLTHSRWHWLVANDLKDPPSPSQRTRQYKAFPRLDVLPFPYPPHVTPDNLPMGRDQYQIDRNCKIFTDARTKGKFKYFIPSPTNTPLGAVHGEFGEYDKWILFLPSIDYLHSVDNLWQGDWQSKEYGAGGFDNFFPRNCKLSDSACAFLLIKNVSGSVLSDLYPLDWNANGDLYRDRQKIGSPLTFETSDGTSVLGFNGQGLHGQNPETQGLPVLNLRRDRQDKKESTRINWTDVDQAREAKLLDWRAFNLLTVRRPQDDMAGKVKTPVTGPPPKGPKVPTTSSSPAKVQKKEK